jgi:hypothetical protein
MERVNGYLLLWFVRKKGHESEDLHLGVSPERSILQPFSILLKKAMQCLLRNVYFIHAMT